MGTRLNTIDKDGNLHGIVTTAGVIRKAGERLVDRGLDPGVLNASEAELASIGRREVTQIKLALFD